MFAAYLRVGLLPWDRHLVRQASLKVSASCPHLMQLRFVFFVSLFLIMDIALYVIRSVYPRMYLLYFKESKR